MKDKDIQAIAKETYEELSKNINDDLVKSIIKIAVRSAVRSSEIMLRKYHEKLSQEKK